MALSPALRHSGFRWRPRFDFRNAGLGRVGRLGGWVLVYVLANQLGYLVVVKLAHSTLSGTTTCTSTPALPGSGSYTTYVYAFVVFSLPHAIVAVSVITALLPRMSRHVVDGRPRLLVGELSRGLRLASVILVPAMVALIVLAQQIATTLFRHGKVHTADARVIGWTIAAFAVGLIPFSAFQLHLRAFYAMNDTRTPAYICDRRQRGQRHRRRHPVRLACTAAPGCPGWPSATRCPTPTGVALTSIVLSGRLGSLDASRTVQTLVRLTLASALGGLVAWLLSHLVGAVAGHGFAGSVLALARGAARRRRGSCCASPPGCASPRSTSCWWRSAAGCRACPCHASPVPERSVSTPAGAALEIAVARPYGSRQSSDPPTRTGDSSMPSRQDSSGRRSSVSLTPPR